jgi:transposase
MLPEQLYLIRLSAYSPELNAMEWVWTPLKRDVSEAVWKSLDAMEVAITGGWVTGWLTCAVSMFMGLRQAAFLN